MKVFNPQPGETYRLQAGAHYDARITIATVEGAIFRTTEPAAYDRATFVNWLTKKDVTITKEDLQ